MPLLQINTGNREQNVTCIQELKESFNGKFQQLNLAVMMSFELFLELVTNLFTKLPLFHSSQEGQWCLGVH